MACQSLNVADTSIVLQANVRERKKVLTVCECDIQWGFIKAEQYYNYLSPLITRCNYLPVHPVHPVAPKQVYTSTPMLQNTASHDGNNSKVDICE